MGAIPGNAAGVAGPVGKAGVAPPERGASLGLAEGVCPGVPGGPGGAAATTDAASPVPAGGAGIAAWSPDTSRSLGAAKTKPTAANTASTPVNGAAMREKRLPTSVPSARQRLS